MKRWRTLLKAFLGLAACLFLAEAAWFVHVLDLPRPAPAAGLLAVYGGAYWRYQDGLALERAGSFRFLVFSDASAAYVRQLEERFGPPVRARLLLEPDARTTAQNARYVARLIRRHRCADVLVLTSWWHLPRALFLTHLALWGTGVRIRGWAVFDPQAEVPGRWAWRDPRLWLELGRFWGSLATYESDNRRTESPGEFGGIFDY